MSFDNLCIPEHSKSQLVDLLKRNRLGHAIFLDDLSQGAALPSAIAIAKTLLCDRSQMQGISCGNCKSCTLVDQWSHPDIVFLFPYTKEKKEEWKDVFKAWKTAVQSNPYLSLEEWVEQSSANKKTPTIDVKDVERMLEQFSTTSFYKGKRVLVLWQGDIIKASVANKLLKFIEEPSQSTQIIFAGGDPAQLLPTIASRLQSFVLPPPSPQELYTILRTSYSEEEAYEAASLSQGSVKFALRYIEGGQKLEIFSQSFVVWIRSCFGLVKGQGIEESLAFVHNLAAKNRSEQEDFLGYVLEALRKAFLMNYKLENLSTVLLGRTPFQWEKLAPFIHADNFPFMVDEISKAQQQIVRNISAKIIWTDLTFTMARLLHKKLKTE